MTTPSVDLNIAMPYGVTVQGSDGVLIPTVVGAHPKKRGMEGLTLTPGPCRISASWSGPEEMRLILNTKAGLKRLLTIPAQSGGGVALSDGHLGSARRRVRLYANRQRETRRSQYRHHRDLPTQLRVATTAGAVV